MNWRIVVAQHAAQRSASVAHGQLARGLDGLATVAATAPFLGMAGTLGGIYSSFHGVCGERTALMAALAGELSEAILPAAFGLAVAIAASWSYQHLSARLAAFDTEMRSAVRDLAGYLAG